MFFQGFNVIKETIILSGLTYIAIIFILRTSGKRTLASFNAFDFLITVTIGSISATTILSKDTKFFDGITAIVSLVILQFLVAKISVNSKIFRRVIKSEPTLLYHKGEFIYKNMNKMRVSKDDILQEVRIVGGLTIDKVHSIILEANGKLSIVTDGSKESLNDLYTYK